MKTACDQGYLCIDIVEAEQHLYAELTLKILDLTHPIEADMPVYPTTKPPSIVEACTIDRDGFAELRVTLYTHTGTHLDAPAHLLPGGKTLEQFPAGHFIGSAVVLKVSGKQPGETIEIADLEEYEDLIGEASFILLQTGWSRCWGAEGYFKGYPVLSTDAATWLAGFALKGVGIDAISFDPEDSTEFPLHKIFLERDIILIENLTGLEQLPRGLFTFSCLPLKLTGGDGSPVRAVALLD